MVILTPGQLLWGQMKGFPWWPGIAITTEEIERNRFERAAPDRQWVRFFGTASQYACLHGSQIQDFLCQRRAAFLSNRSKALQKALTDVRIFCNHNPSYCAVKSAIDDHISDTSDELPFASLSSVPTATSADNREPDINPVVNNPGTSKSSMRGQPPFTQPLPVRTRHSSRNSGISDPDYHPSDDGDSDDDRNMAAFKPVGEKGYLEFQLTEENSGRRKGPPKGPHNWTRNKRKRARLTGQEYTMVHTAKRPQSRRRPAKSVLAVDCNNCRFKCSEVISQARRESIFAEYYGLDSEQRQRDFVRSRVRNMQAKRPGQYSKKTKDFPTHRIRHHRIYTLLDENREEHVVCSKFFCSTLAISNRPVITALMGGSQAARRKSALDAPPMETLSSPILRGKHPKPNKTSASQLESVVKHIDSFPRVSSHYCRSESQRKYLPQELTVAKMYDLYLEACKSEDLTEVLQGSQPVKQGVYRQVFHKEFNLGFHRPKKDQCVVCMTYHSKRAAGALTDNAKSTFSTHIRLRDCALAMKNSDKIRAKADPSFYSITFDLQSVLYTPCSQVSLMYYKRKLAVYNFTIYQQAPPNNGFCFLWPEYEGNRGACEIGTALHSFIQNLPESVTHLSTFSDNCTGQNRNRHIAMMFLRAVVESRRLELIDQKFLERGHTHMEADSMHSAIERAKKGVTIYTYHSWRPVLELARRHNRYDVRELKHDHFLNWKSYGDRFLGKSKQVKWMKVKWLRFHRDHPSTIFYKLELDESLPFEELHLSPQHTTYAVPPLYKSQLPLSSLKSRDLISLTVGDTPIIPPEFHKYYRSLPSSASVGDRLPLSDVEEASDSDSE